MKFMILPMSLMLVAPRSAIALSRTAAVSSSLIIFGRKMFTYSSCDSSSLTKSSLPAAWYMSADSLCCFAIF